MSEERIWLSKIEFSLILSPQQIQKFNDFVWIPPGQNVPDINFLLVDMRVVCNQRIVRTLSEFDKTSYRILDSPIDELILDDLKSGAWTTEELSDKYGIDHQQIDDLIHYVTKKQEDLESGRFSFEE